MEGDIVTFKHRGFMIGTKKPKMPALHRIRHDITWDDVINNWKEQKPSGPGTNQALAVSYFYFYFYFIFL